MDEKFKYVRPTTLWETKVKQAQKMLDKQYLNRKDKEFINKMLKESKLHMNDLEHNTWRVISFKQGVELLLKLGTPLFYQKAEIQKAKDIKAKIKVADKDRMWNSIVANNAQLNLMLKQLGGDVFFNIYGEATDEMGNLIEVDALGRKRVV